jgi:hypothetical protein
MWEVWVAHGQRTSTIRPSLLRSSIEQTYGPQEASAALAAL